jgi:hypothetical protein
MACSIVLICDEWCKVIVYLSQGFSKVAPSDLAAAGSKKELF